MGRPKKTDGTTKCYRGDFRMTEVTKEQVDYWSRETGLSKSEVFAKAMTMYDKSMKTRGYL